MKSKTLQKTLKSLTGQAKPLPGHLATSPRRQKYCLSQPGDQRQNSDAPVREGANLETTLSGTKALEIFSAEERRLLSRLKCV